ncbi:hypothetical protein AAHA92_01933 [Salvia divinorum]|uniref:FHA domain-containing protein n=1 Tax=Salvia divinorum TaxID=28513 RepID=A0ABD1IC74_SALDI
MGAMAPPPHWIPQDDVLLKHAVEAGASLESLAKGAVQFSRRYTVQELQDRWVSILYDPLVSEEASVHMFEVERSGVINQLRPNKFEGVQDVACSSGKKRAESVRKHYYAMRKRICIEPLYMIDGNLAYGPGYSNFRDGNEFSSADCEVGTSASNILGDQGPDYSIRPHLSADLVPHAAESTGNGLTPTFSGVQNHGQEDLGEENVSNDFPYPYEENISLTGDCSEIPGFVQSKDLPPCNLFDAEGLVNQASACSEFGGQSFHSFGCSPPLPHMLITNSSHDISAAELPIEIADADLQLSDALGYGDGPSNLEFETPLSRHGMIDLTSRTQDSLEELFDLSNDEGLLYMDTDGKEDIEKSYLVGLSSLLLDSPNQCDLSGPGLGEAAVVAHGHLFDRSDTRDGGSYNEDLRDQQEVADVQVSASGSTMKVGPEYCNGVIWCTLNTEDPDIPSNDDVFLPYRFPSLSNSSGSHWALHDSSYLGSSSVKNFSSTSNVNGGHLVMKNTQTDSYVPSGRMGPFHPSDAGLRGRRDNRVKFELPESSVQHEAPRNSEIPNNVSLASAKANNLITGVVKEGPTEMGQGKNIGRTPLNPCRDKHESNLDIHQNLQKNSVGCRSGVDCISEIPINKSPIVGMSFQHNDVLKEIDHSLLPDQEELLFENESDVPYFSDVEAVILGMDLGPDDFDLYTNPEVQRCQLEETKRTIIRLEQSADAFTHRAIAGQGAFAVLHGRFSRYLIKKPEVLLGRATDDNKVDIDLGREKNGGKISRRQATMKMDMYGTFHLKNLGRTPVYVNGKEVSPGQSLCLISGCLIEVRGLSFVLETNRKAIKQYMDSSAGEGGLAEFKPSVTC